MKPKAQKKSAAPRRCFACGCTESNPCQIEVFITTPDGSSKLAVSRACSWSRCNPSCCTSCDATHDSNGIESIILGDLFPEAAPRFDHSAPLKRKKVA